MMGTTIREDELSSDIVVVSANRAKRPHIQTRGTHKKIKACPFCPGNEGMTPAEHQAGMYAGLRVWALTDVVVILAWGWYN